MVSESVEDLIKGQEASPGSWKQVRAWAFVLFLSGYSDFNQSLITGGIEYPLMDEENRLKYFNNLREKLYTPKMNFQLC